MIDVIRTRCWTHGYVAPTEWVIWLVDLQLDKFAADHGLQFHDAIAQLPVHILEELADSLVQIAQSEQN